MIPSFSGIDALRRFSPVVNHLPLFQSTSSTLEVPKVREVCESLWSLKGKRLRSHLVYWFGEMSGVDPDSLDLYAWAAEAVHTATLLHDDVIDLAEFRRGAPSANQVYGNTVSILSGDYLLSEAVQQVALHGSRDLLVSMCETVKQLVQGECVQHDLKFRIPESEGVFRQVNRLKTSSLLVWSSLVGPTLTTSPIEIPVRHFIERFGALFQMTDDLMDVLGSEEKGRWSDLKDGKLNYPTWRLIEENLELRNSVVAAFGARTVDLDLIKVFETHLRNDRHALDGVRDEIDRLEADCHRALERLPRGGIRRALADLVELCADRVG